MNSSPISTAESIYWSKEITQLVEKSGLQREEVEEVFLNLPKVKKISLSFPDTQDRFYVEGFSDRGKKIGLVMYILKKKIQLTFVKKI
jgi:hypothetical protein